MHNGRANDCNHLSNGRHARDFSLKVPAKPVIKIGVGVPGFAADIRRLSRRKVRAEIRKLDTIVVHHLIDFVGEGVSHSEFSPEEARRIATYLTTADLTGRGGHGVMR